LTFPEAAWECSLGIYLIAKGFRSDAPVFTRVRVDTRADQRMLGRDQAVAPDAAVMAGV
jgi:hypothetical protein